MVAAGGGKLIRQFFVVDLWMSSSRQGICDCLVQPCAYSCIPRNRWMDDPGHVLVAASVEQTWRERYESVGSKSD